MNIIGLLLGALTAISVFATGCQPASQDQINKARQAFGYESDQPKIDTSVSSITGSWYGACARDVQRDEFYKQDTINITSGYIEYSSSFFFDSACSSIAFQQSLGGNFQLEKEKIKFGRK